VTQMCKALRMNYDVIIVIVLYCKLYTALLVQLSSIVCIHSDFKTSLCLLIKKTE